MAYTNEDLVSSELKGLAISSSTSPSSDDISSWAKQAQDEIEAKTGKVWEVSTFSSTIYDGDGTEFFRFPFAPVISISSFEHETSGLGASSSSWTSLTEGRNNDFILYVNDGEVEFTGKSSKPVNGKQNIRVSGSYGYAVTPPRIQRLATLMVAKRVVDATINASSQEEGGSVTVGNISITDPSTFSVSASRSMGVEIKDLFDDLAGTSFVYRPSRTYRLGGF